MIAEFRRGLFDACRALRPSQWTKNLLVLAAFFFAYGDRTQPDRLGAAHFVTAVVAMLLFCITSSGIYLINDLRDLAQDRLHPRKRYRPLAAGRISAPFARTTALLLLAAGIAGGAFISREFGEVLIGYVAMQIAYTFALKHVALVESFVIAIGFVLRALGGALAIHVSISPWLLLCTFLLALFLALCKRRHEKIELEEAGDEVRASLASYSRELLDQLIAIVSAATIVSYAIYTLWPDTVKKFGSYRLGLTIPIVIFGLFRYLDLVYRHDKGDRPEKILLTDAPLLACIGIYAVAVILVFVL